MTNQDQNLYPGRYRFVDYWSDSILNFTMRDEQNVIYSPAALSDSKATPFSKMMSGVDGLKIVFKSSKMMESTIPTTSFEQEDFIPYLQLEEEGGFDRKIISRSEHVPIDKKQEPVQHVIPLRFHDEGLKSFTFMMRRLSTMKQFLNSSILPHNVEALFGNYEKKSDLFRRMMNSPIDIRAHLYPDTTLSMCVKYAVSPFIFQHEMRVPNVIVGSSSTPASSGFTNESLVSVKSRRGHSELFQSFAPDSSMTVVLSLFRAYQSQHVSVDLGGSVLARDFMPGNLTYATRFNITSPLSKKKSSVVLNGSVLGHMHLSYTTPLSKIYGLAASAQLRYNSTNTKSELALGVKCTSPPGAEDYSFSFRVDTEKGIAGMVEKRKFLNNDKINVGIAVAKTTPFDQRSTQPLLSDLKLGLNLQFEW